MRFGRSFSHPPLPCYPPPIHAQQAVPHTMRSRQRLQVIMFGLCVVGALYYGVHSSYHIQANNDPLQPVWQCHEHSISKHIYRIPLPCKPCYVMRARHAYLHAACAHVRQYCANAMSNMRTKCTGKVPSELEIFIYFADWLLFLPAACVAVLRAVCQGTRMPPCAALSHHQCGA